MKKRTLLFLIPILAFVLLFVGRTIYYYRGFYISPKVPQSQPDRFEVLSEPLTESLLPIDSLAGTVLVDFAHYNNFTEDELNILFGRITAAGGEVELLELGDDLEEELRFAGSFVVIANKDAFTPSDVLVIEEFVRKGGRLVIIGDPTRLVSVNNINSLAGQFGIIYQEDYVYNLVDNDGSYLNIILTSFEENVLTAGLEKIVFQGAHSLRVKEGALIMGDENTFSSLREKPGDVTLVALTTNGRVLALPDMTFLTGPYNTFADNDLFIDNIVRFLLTSTRTFALLDFPYYFEDSVFITYTNTALLEDIFEDAITLREELSGVGLEAAFSDSPSEDSPLVFLGLYSKLDSSTIATLKSDGIEISGSNVTIEGIGELDLDDMALFHLHQTTDGVYQLFILAEDDNVLAGAIEMLLKDDLEDCLVVPNTALCEPKVTKSTSTPTPKPTSTPTLTPTPDGTPGTEEPSDTPEATPTPTS